VHPKLVAAAVVALVLSSAAACSSSGDSKGLSSATTTSKAAANSGRVTELKLDSGHDYGNKYANGILPVGDGKFVTDAAKKGSVYLCRAPQGQAGGAGSRGPWFTNNNTEYDINKKIAVEGNVSWDASYSETVSGGSRVITTNACRATTRLASSRFSRLIPHTSTTATRTRSRPSRSRTR